MINVNKLFIPIVTILTLPFAVQAQTFSSGSTGADGALNCPPVCRVQLPESGVLNYTTVTIGYNQFLTFKRNSRNSPVILLAQGDVTVGVMAYMDVSAGSDPDQPASGLTPGPGGFYGGALGFPGFGPGGGVLNGDVNGKWIGPLSLVPVVGGSGGAGANCSGGGGGGGGAIVIASSTTII
jgi:hypothetical protein